MPEMFRKKAVDRLRSPDRIDEVLSVLHRRNWVPVAIIGGLCLCAATWMLLGKVPVTSTGSAIILTPSTIVPFHTATSGQLASWRVAVGDQVRKDQLLAVLALPEAEEELAQSRARLAELQKRNEELGTITGRKGDLERQAIVEKREFLAQRVAALQGEITTSRRLAEELRTKNLEYLTKQRQNLEETRKTTNAIGQELEKRAQSYRTLRDEGLTSRDVVLEATRSTIENKLKLADLELKLQELELAEVRGQETYLQSVGRVSDMSNQLTELELQLHELDIQGTQLQQRSSELSHARSMETGDLERHIAALEGQLLLTREIRSEHTGRILELTAVEGTRVGAGFRLGTIDARTEDSVLVTMAYFQVGAGKKVHPGMKVRVAPSTVERERYGSIIGEVRTVSGFPVSAESVGSTVGNLEVARGLTEGGNQIEMVIDLRQDPSTESGFAWTSRKGPPMRITAGTTAVATVTTEERIPISFVIPILRSWTGL